MPTWLIHIVSWIHREHRASEDVEAFARESCILVANKIRVRKSATYALCSLPHAQLLARVQRLGTLSFSRRGNHHPRQKKRCIVGTVGLGPTAPASRPRPIKDHRMMAQSTGPIVFLYQSTLNIHHHPDRIYTS